MNTTKEFIFCARKKREMFSGQCFLSAFIRSTRISQCHLQRLLDVNTRSRAVQQVVACQLFIFVSLKSRIESREVNECRTRCVKRSGYFQQGENYCVVIRLRLKYVCS